MDQTTVITNSFRGMEEERRDGGTDAKRMRREGKKEEENVGREKIAGKKVEGGEEEGRMKEQRMAIRGEETEGQVSVDAEGQIRLCEKGSWG